MTQADTRSISLRYLYFLLFLSPSYFNASVQAAPSSLLQSSLYRVDSGGTEHGSAHVQIARNHAAQSRRRRDPEALLKWADGQASRMKDRHRGGNKARKGKTSRRTSITEDSLSPHVKRQNDQQGHEELHNLFSDTEYFGTVSVGTPPRTFNVILDTGSADLWLAGSGCSQATGCDSTTQLYQTNESSSALLRTSSGAVRGGNTAASINTGNIGDEFRISYGSGEASGTLVSDSVTLAGYSVSNQTFGSCRNVTEGLLAGPVSGIMGLGFENISKSRTTPWWENLAKAGQLGTNQEMGFAFTRFLHYDGGEETQVMPGGVASFGSANQTLYTGDVSWNAINDPGYWMISLQDVSIGNTSLAITSDRVAIDTGTSLIGAPTSAVDAIFAQVPGSIPSDDPKRKGYYYFPCNTTVRVAFTFNNTIWNIHPSDFNLGRVAAEGMCLGAFFSLEEGSTTADRADQNDGPAWIVGDTFLKNVYSIFRYENPRAVGFAKLSDLAKGMSNRTSVAVTNHNIAVSSAHQFRITDPALLSGLAISVGIVASTLV